MTNHNENCAIYHNSIDECDCERGQIRALKERVKELEQQFAVSELAVQFCDPIVDELNLTIRQFQARIRELDGIDRKWNDINSMNVEIHERLEAKLATAVEALEEIRDNQYLSEVVSETLREALAKIRS